MLGWFLVALAIGQWVGVVEMVGRGVPHPGVAKDIEVRAILALCYCVLAYVLLRSRA